MLNMPMLGRGRSIQPKALPDMLWDSGCKHLGNQNYQYALRDFEGIKASKFVFFNMALCYGGLHDYPKFCEYLDKAIELDPKYDKAVFAKVEWLVEKGQHEAALDVIKRYRFAGGNNEEALQEFEPSLKMLAKRDAILKKVLKNIRAKITSSNDIIPAVDRPCKLNLDTIQSFINQYGPAKTLAYINHRLELEKISTILDVKLTGSNTIEMVKLACAEWRVGECGVLVFSALQECAMELAGLEGYCSLVAFKSCGSAELVDKHAFLLLSEKEIKITQLADLEKLADSAVIFDPFLLDKIGQANQFRGLIGNYLDKYQITELDISIENGYLKSDGLVDFHTNLKRGVIELYERSKIDYERSEFDEVYAKFFPLVEKTCLVAYLSLMLSLASFSADERLKQISEALEKFDFSLALRLACAFGKADVVEKIVSIVSDESKLLQAFKKKIALFPEAVFIRRFQFNINERSGTKEKTALDWANQLKQGANKSKIIELITKAGAKTYAAVYAASK